MRALTLAAAALVLGGCANDLEKQSQVTKLRVLAVRAEPAELVVLPGFDGGLPKTTLTALAVEPSGAPVSIQYALCAFIGNGPAARLDCPGDAGIALDAGGEPLSAVLDLGDPRLLDFVARLATGSDGGGFLSDAGGALAAGLQIGRAHV